MNVEQEIKSKKTHLSSPRLSKEQSAITAANEVKSERNKSPTLYKQLPKSRSTPVSLFREWDRLRWKESIASLSREGDHGVVEGVITMS